MLKLATTVLAVAIAASASADDLGSLRVDASSAQAFERSLAEFKAKLSPEQCGAFGAALKDIWLAGTQSAEADQRKYGAAGYYRQIDGLSYDQVVQLTTGATAKVQCGSGMARSSAAPAARRSASTYQRPPPLHGVPAPPPAFLERPRGGNNLFGPSVQQ